MLSKKIVYSLLAGASIAGSATAADASIVMGVRAAGTYADTNRNGFAPLSGSDTPTSVQAVNGKVISIIVYAQITQPGAVGDPPAGTGWPTFGSTSGRISTGPTGVKANVVDNRLDQSVMGAAFYPGTFVDLDGDGDVDDGNTDAHADSLAGWISYYMNGAQSTPVGPGATTNTGASIFGMRPDGSSAQPTPVPGGFEYYMGEVVLVVANANLPDSTVNWHFRPGFTSGWYENMTRIVTPSKFGPLVSYFGGPLGSGTVSVGTGVTLKRLVPEPSAALCIAGVANLLARLPRRTSLNRQSRS